jgi:hypothetical protein
MYLVELLCFLAMGGFRHPQMTA